MRAREEIRHPDTLAVLARKGQRLSIPIMADIEEAGITLVKCLADTGRAFDLEINVQ